MADFSQRFGQWALVAGAAEGLGASFCEELALKGMNVIMFDINEKGMESLGERLKKQYHVQTRKIIQDLAEENAPVKCMAVIKETGCRLLIYNAAYSRVKPFLSNEFHELDLYIDVNTRTPLKLAYLFAQHLKHNNQKGGILLMSSLSGIWGTRLVTAYSGTKGFNLLFAEALSNELRPHGIDVSVCCAGATATPGYLGTNPAKGFLSPPLMKPDHVASIALKHLGKKTVIIPGFSNRFSYFLLTRLLPRSLSVRLVNQAMKKTYADLSVK